MLRAGCPSRSASFVCIWCGELVDARCRRLACGYCGPVEALKLAAAVAMAEGERLITVTQVGATWTARRRRMRLLGHRLRQVVGPMEWAWSVEPNPRHTGYHVHAVQWGSYVPVRVLSSLADSEGLGRVVDVRRLNRHAGSSMYLVKLAGDAYGLKGATNGATREAFLEANGGRQLLHTSRGFWRDGLQPIEARRPRRVAVARAMARMHGPAVCRHHWSEMSRGPA